MTARSLDGMRAWTLEFQSTRSAEAPKASGSSGTTELLQRPLQRRGSSSPELFRHDSIKFSQHAFSDGLEAPSLLCEMNQSGSAVKRIRVAFHEAVALAEADERCHCLLRELDATRDLPHPKAIFLEERNQDRPVRRSNLRKSRSSEALLKSLIPMLRGLREQVSEIVSRRTGHGRKATRRPWMCSRLAALRQTGRRSSRPKSHRLADAAHPS